MYSWETDNLKVKLREQFDNILEMWLRKTPHNNSEKTGIYIHGVIDGLYLMASSLIKTEELPILTQVRKEVHDDYGKMFNCEADYR
jgi:hypothetical protein